MQVLGLAKIQLAEDFSSVGVLEWVPETWKYMKFVQFLVKSADFVAIWPNKFLSGEFHLFCRNGHYLVKSTGLVAIRMNKFLTGEFCVFSWKNDHYWLWVLQWEFGGKIRFDRTKFVLFVVKVTDWVVSLGEMVQSSCYKINYKIS